MKRDVEGKIAWRFDSAAVSQQDCAVGDYLKFDELMNWDAGRFTPPARLAVIGDPISHSRSPQMHNPALQDCGIDAQYIRVQVPEGRVGEAFRQFAKCGFLGVNITIPHKFEALAEVDEIDPLARQLGAVNTLAIRGGRLLGYNSDGPGFLRSVKEAFGAEVKDLRVLVLGAGGGAGRAIAVQSALAGCKKIVLANRTLEKAHEVMCEIREIGQTAQVGVVEMDHAHLSHQIDECDLIVNATSLGMKADDAPLVPAEALESRHLIFDMVYRADGETPLLAAARRSGASSVDGLTLLLHQGAISFEHWFGRAAPLEAMRQGLQTSNNC